MKILVIGGTGHIGSYLVSRLILERHDVQVVARKAEPHYCEPRLGWRKVQWIIADRRAEEKDDSWQKRMKALKVDIVIDLICYTPEQNQIMVGAFEGRIRQFLHCGTIWAYGPPRRVPYKETDPRKPIGQYGYDKARIEENLLTGFHKDGFPASVIHPGHICGRKWLPIDPQATRNGVGVYERLSRGETVYLPDDGGSTLHHVHADDVAQMFMIAIKHPKAVLGESFSAVASYAMTLLGCCEAVASLFGREPNLKFLPLAKMEEVLGKEAFGSTKDHVEHSPSCSIDKAQRLLGYQPSYTTEEIYRECIEYILESGQLKLS